MKKIKFLLSITPIVAVTGIPVIATSCGANYVEPIEMVNMLGDEPYTPSFPTLSQKLPEVKELYSSDASKYYIEEMSQNPEHFKEDMLYFSSIHVQNCFASALNYDGSSKLILSAAEVGVSKPTFGKTKVWERGFEDKEVDTISFKKKIHLTYTSEKGAASPITRDFDCEISYSNVILSAYEHFKNEKFDGEASGWAIGILDETVGTEAFWTHKYNINPWSISYSCVDQQTKRIPGQEGTPDVEIHNSEYYSGYIDNGASLYDLWTYRNRSFESEEEENKAKLECYFIDSVLMLRNRSYFLSDVSNIPDVCLTEPLYVALNGETAGPVDVEIKGINFISSFGTISDVSIQLDPEKIADDVVATATDDDKTITIKKDASLKKADIGYYIEGTISDGLYPRMGAEEIHPFALNIESLPIKISYTGSDLKPKVQKTTLNLHYNSITVHVTHLQKNTL